MYDQPITAEQVRMIASLSSQLGLPLPTADELAEMTKWQASELITQLRSGAAPIDNIDDLEAAVMERVAERTRTQAVQGRSAKR
jgi:hypothetical protein